jgi:hypothetical protein
MGRHCQHGLKEFEPRETVSLELVNQTLNTAKQLYAAVCEANQRAVKQFAAPETFPVFSVAAHRVLLSQRDDPQNCHQCKLRKPIDYMVSCTKCPKTLCEPCLWNRYGWRSYRFWLSKEWKCPVCLSICNCAACTYVRGVPFPKLTVRDYLQRALIRAGRVCSLQRRSSHFPTLLRRHLE